MHDMLRRMGDLRILQRLNREVLIAGHRYCRHSSRLRRCWIRYDA